MDEPVVLPPYKSLSAMRKALEEQYPAPVGRIKKGGDNDIHLVEAYKRAKRKVKIALLELAGAEAALKERIGLGLGLEMAEGTFLWTQNDESRGKIQWMRLVQDLKVPEETLKKYRGPGKKRAFFFTHRKFPPKDLAQAALKAVQQESEDLENEQEAAH